MIKDDPFFQSSAESSMKLCKMTDRRTDRQTAERRREVSNADRRLKRFSRRRQKRFEHFTRHWKSRQAVATHRQGLKEDRHCEWPLDRPW